MGGTWVTVQFPRRHGRRIAESTNLRQRRRERGCPRGCTARHRMAEADLGIAVGQAGARIVSR